MTPEFRSGVRTVALEEEIRIGTESALSASDGTWTSVIAIEISLGSSWPQPLSVGIVSAVGRHRHSDGCHSFHATGITAYLKNGGQLEVAQRMANHESARTTGLYDRLRRDELSVDEVERILI